MAQENKIPIWFWLANVNGWHQSNQSINHTWHRWGSNVYPCDHWPNTLQTEISPRFIGLQIFLLNFYGNTLEMCNQLFLWSCVTCGFCIHNFCCRNQLPGTMFHPQPISKLSQRQYYTYCYPASTVCFRTVGNNKVRLLSWLNRPLR